MTICREGEKMKKQSQCNRVMQYMRDFGSISTREAFDDLGVTRLSGRIYDLKKQGVPIADSMEKSKNRYGETVTYKRYRIDMARSVTPVHDMM